MEKKFLTVDEAAQILGVAPDTVRRYITDLPFDRCLIAFKPAGQYFIRIEDLTRFIQRGQVRKEE